MSVSAQAGIFGFGPQAAKGTIAEEFYRHRATLVDIDLADDVREGPPEVGGVAVPTFPYKAGPVVAGGATIQPRLESSIGWLLYALLGNIDSSEVRPDGLSYQHDFKFSSTDTTFVPWLSFQKYIPKLNGESGTDFLQQYLDCKLISAAFTFPNDGPITARLDAIGRRMSLIANPMTPVGSPPVAPMTWENVMEHWNSIPVGCFTGGYITIQGANDVSPVDLPVVAAQVGFQNVPLDLRMERVYGDPYLDDVTIVQRRLSFDITVKYQNSELYRQVLSGSKEGTEWGQLPFTASLAIKTVSAALMPGTASPSVPTSTDPYSLEITAPEVLLNQVGGLTLAGNQAVLMRFTGVAIDPITPSEDFTDYVNFALINETEEYDWPD